MDKERRAKLRPDIQIRPFVHGQQKGVLLQDPLREEVSLFLSDGAALILPYLDGKKTIQEIQVDLSRRLGQIVFSADIVRLIEQLDTHLFLEGERFEAYLHQEVRRYREAPHRSAALAGKGYPARPEALRRYLNELLDGPPPQNVSLAGPWRGLVAPHIDLERGRETYRETYRLLAAHLHPELVIVLGVNHHFVSDNPFIFTRQNYATPLGILPTDREALDYFRKTLSWDIFQDELAHRNEHSIEFPALLLNHLYGNKALGLLPILSNWVFLDDPRVEEFVQALRSFLDQTDKQVLVLASVDFSHLGPMFGWRREVSEGDARDVARRDLHTLQLLEKGDAEAFYWNVMEDGNARHIDALGACYVLLKALAPVQGKLIKYEQAYHPLNTVTFAGLVLS